MFKGRSFSALSHLSHINFKKKKKMMIKINKNTCKDQLSLVMTDFQSEQLDNNMSR